MIASHPNTVDYMFPYCLLIATEGSSVFTGTICFFLPGASTYYCPHLILLLSEKKDFVILPVRIKIVSSFSGVMPKIATCDKHYSSGLANAIF